ncbi:37S ribosomal protein S9, mitochondrial [Savitreella phatthalungensis]
MLCKRLTTQKALTKALARPLTTAADSSLTSARRNLSSSSPSKSTGVSTSSKPTSSSASYDPSVLFRFKPASASYFTGNSVYQDNLLALESLVRRCKGLPEYKHVQDIPPTSWRTVEQYRNEVDPTSHVRPTDYRRLTELLNKLNRIDRDHLPADVAETMALFTRQRVALDKERNVRTVDAFGRSLGLGRRKESTGRVWCVPGEGEVFVNGLRLNEVFPKVSDREQVTLPLFVGGRANKYNVWAYADGGGHSGQAGALKLALARALIVHEPDLKPILRKAGCITSDPRRVERKKPGRPKARKGYTWVKR